MAREKKKHTYCIEFISKYSYCENHIYKLYKDGDSVIMDFINKLIELNYPENANNLDFFSTPQLLELKQRIEYWGSVRRTEMSKNKGRRAGSKNKPSTIKTSLEEMNIKLESVLTELQMYKDNFEKLSEKINYLYESFV